MTKTITGCHNREKPIYVKVIDLGSFMCQDCDGCWNISEMKDLNQAIITENQISRMLSDKH